MACYSFATEWTGFSFFSKDNVKCDCLKLMGSLDVFFSGEVMDFAHKMRLTKSLVDKFNIRGETSAILHPGDCSVFGPSTLLQYHKKGNSPTPVMTSSSLKPSLNYGAKRGKQSIVVENGEGNILWKWEAEPPNQFIESEPLIERTFPKTDPINYPFHLLAHPRVCSIRPLSSCPPTTFLSWQG